jgi:hypothetical protein
MAAQLGPSIEHPGFPDPCVRPRGNTTPRPSSAWRIPPVRTAWPRQVGFALLSAAHSGGVGNMDSSRRTGTKPWHPWRLGDAGLTTLAGSDSGM